MTEINRAMHRALVEAGYAPLSEYIAVECGGCAPPVLVPATPAERGLDAGKGRHDAGPLAPVPFHHEVRNAR